MFAAYGLAFFVGGILVNSGAISFADMARGGEDEGGGGEHPRQLISFAPPLRAACVQLQSFFALIMAAQGAGQAAGMAGDAAKADKAKRAIFALSALEAEENGGADEVE